MSTSVRRAHWSLVLVACAVLLGCLYYLVFGFEWTEALALLGDADPVPFLLGGAFSILSFWALRAWRWSMMLRGYGLRIPYVRLFHVTAVSLALSVVTPFQSGELLKVEWLKRHGYLGRKRGYGNLAVEKALDLGVVLGLGGSGILLFPAAFAYAGWASLAGVPIAAWGVWSWRERIPLRWRRQVLILFAGVGSWARLCALVALTVCLWVAVAIGWRYCLISIGVDLSLWRAIVLVAWVTLLGIASMIPGAVGVSEVSVAGILAGWGVDIAAAHAAALIVRLFSVLILALGGGVYLIGLLARGGGLSGRRQG